METKKQTFLCQWCRTISQESQDVHESYCVNKIEENIWKALQAEHKEQKRTVPPKKTKKAVQKRMKKLFESILKNHPTFLPKEQPKPKLEVKKVMQINQGEIIDCDSKIFLKQDLDSSSEIVENQQPKFINGTQQNTSAKITFNRIDLLKNDKTKPLNVEQKKDQLQKQQE